MLKLNTKIYDKKAIRKAIVDFSGICRFHVVFKDNYALIDHKDKKVAEKNLIENELCNYVLGLTKKCL